MILLGDWRNGRRYLSDILPALLASETPETLVLDAVPRYEIDAVRRRLRAAGELIDGQWQAAARAAYLALLAEQPAGEQAQRLDRLPAQDRPREKALLRGIDALGDNELLAVLLRTGGSEGVMSLAEGLLHDHGGLIGLAACDILDLLRSRGIGEAKACELAAAFELGRRLARASLGPRPEIRQPRHVVDYLGPLLAGRAQEELWILPLDVRSRLIGEPLPISRGDVDGTEAGPRLVFRHAMRANASSCIVVHNHPSGDAQPSQSDRLITQRLAEAGRIIGIPLNDHVIIGDPHNWHSLRSHEPHLFAGS